jgi:hypothetical protein
VSTEQRAARTPEVRNITMVVLLTYRIKKYVNGSVSSGMTFTPHLMKIYPLVQDLLGRRAGRWTTYYKSFPFIYNMDNLDKTMKYLFLINFYNERFVSSLNEHQILRTRTETFS